MSDISRSPSPPKRPVSCPLCRVSQNDLRPSLPHSASSLQSVYTECYPAVLSLSDANCLSSLRSAAPSPTHCKHWQRSLSQRQITADPDSWPVQVCASAKFLEGL